MRCIYCDNSIIESGKNFGKPMTAPGKGVAHTLCYTKDLINQRVFRGLKIAVLDIEELSELKEMVLIEMNARAPAVMQEIDLF